MNEETIFELKVTGVDLDKIKPSQLAILMQPFAKMLGEDNLAFSAIKAGSACIQLKTPVAYWENKIQNIKQSIAARSSEFRSIQDIANKHTDWNIDILSGSQPECLYTFKPEPKGFLFSQAETIRGRLTRLVDGQDETDHIGLRLEDGRSISIACSSELSKKLSLQWKNNAILELHGQAKYRYIDFRRIELQSFEAQSFTILENLSMAQWIDDFIGDGQSGWSQFENPIEHWLQERHS